MSWVCKDFYEYNELYMGTSYPWVYAKIFMRNAGVSVGVQQYL